MTDDSLTTSSINATGAAYIVLGGEVTRVYETAPRPKHVNVRMPESVLSDLRERAALDGRSLNGEIVFLLKEAIAGKKRKPAESRDDQKPT